MKRTFQTGCGLALLAACAAMAATPAPESKLTAAQIAERNVAARGGLAAWHAVNAQQRLIARCSDLAGIELIA